MSVTLKADTTTATKNAINLKGFGINSILYQRGIYPAESFKRHPQYGMTLLITNDPKLEEFMKPLLEQIKQLLESKELKRLVIVISSVNTKEVLERWQFDIEMEGSSNGNNPPLGDGNAAPAPAKPEKVIRQEIGDIMRQIAASVTFLPLLDVACSFDVLIYTKKNTETPAGWAESGPCAIVNSQEVQLRTFSTCHHRVETRVQYRQSDL